MPSGSDRALGRSRDGTAAVVPPEVRPRGPVQGRLAIGADFPELRHYCASLLIRHGESVKVVQAQLGHKSVPETLDTYGYLWPDSEGSTRAAVDLVLGPGRQAPTGPPQSGRAGQA